MPKKGLEFCKAHIYVSGSNYLGAKSLEVPEKNVLEVCFRESYLPCRIPNTYLDARSLEVPEKY